jgi:beta-lactam-binding protein with PASTA domain
MMDNARRLWTSSTFRILLAGCVVVIVFAAVMVATHSSNASPTLGAPSAGETTTNSEVVVPKVVGLPQDAAQVLLQAEGLTATVTIVPGSGTPGLVLTQSPSAKMHVLPGSTITLTAAAGTALPAIPDVNGAPEAAAEAALKAAGFVVRGTQQAFSTVASGDVIATDPPANTPVPANSNVVVIVSKGVQPVKKVIPPRTTTTSKPPKPTTTTSTKPLKATTTTTTDQPTTTTTTTDQPTTTTTTKPPKSTTTTSTTTTTTIPQTTTTVCCGSL